MRLDGDAIKQGGSFIQTDSTSILFFFRCATANSLCCAFNNPGPGELEIVYPSPGVVMLRSVINPRQHIGINKKGNVNGNVRYIL